MRYLDELSFSSASRGGYEAVPETSLGTFKGVTDERTDDQLMVAFMAGDDAAFDELYVRCKSKLESFIGAHVDVHADAQEIFSEVWFRVVRARQTSSYRSSDTFRAWIYTIANNLIRDFYRKTARTPATLDIEAAGMEDTMSHPDGGRRHEQRAEVLRYLGCLEGLSEVQREAHKRLAFGFTYEEIAEHTGAKFETVKKRLAAATRKIRGCMGWS